MFHLAIVMATAKCFLLPEGAKTTYKLTAPAIAAAYAGHFPEYDRSVDFKVAPAPLGQALHTYSVVLKPHWGRKGSSEITLVACTQRWGFGNVWSHLCFVRFRVLFSQNLTSFKQIKNNEMPTEHPPNNQRH